MCSEACLQAAAAIGRRTAAEAIWHDGRCSWLAAVADSRDRSRPEYQPVGPLVYGGTAGIALFLAELAVVTDDAAMRRAALGAMRPQPERTST